MKTLFTFLFLTPFLLGAQVVHVTIILVANEGGFHTNMNVTLVDTLSKMKFTGKTDLEGKVTIDVAPGACYDVKIPNYTQRKLINVPNVPGASMSSRIFYSRNMVAEEAAFAMNDEEKAGVDNYAKTLPDTTFYNTWYAAEGRTDYNCVHIIIELRDFNDQPIEGEVIKVVGRKRHKAFKGTTGPQGKLVMMLPKGDNYDLSFLYHRNFEYTECQYSNGETDVEWSFAYIGTKNYQRQLAEEARRQKAEEERLAAERKRFDDYCALHHYTLEEGHRMEMLGWDAQQSGDLVSKIMQRNNFRDPLIITDVTGSMSPYMAQIYFWYKAFQNSNPKAQFIFFNDGDDMADNKKKIGETGGIYYLQPASADTLIGMLSYASSRGSGGDGPENNMEALIKGVKLAKKPFIDIVMVADNNAPVKDIILLSQFNKPVHIIACDDSEDGVHPDYLKIAWKTNGSIHTASTDYKAIGAMKDGETIKVGKTTYRLMKGEFVKM